MRAKRDCRCPRVTHVHGTYAAYDCDGCRCLPCAVAQSRWKAAWKAGTVRERNTAPVHGTRRRLQALTAMGWSPPELGVLTGLNDQVILRLRAANDARTVLFQTRDAVTAVYDDIWATRSTGRHQLRMRNLARRHGWLPPLAWDDDSIDDPAATPNLGTAPAVDLDEVAIREAIAGRRVPLTRAERREAVTRMTDARYSAQEIAARLGTYQRQVTRDRAKERSAA
jgi:hypothetical protein